MLLAAAGDAARIVSTLKASGFAVAQAQLGDGGRGQWVAGTGKSGTGPARTEAAGTGAAGTEPAGTGAAQEPGGDSLASEIVPTSMRSAQAAIATALRLPETAGTNLDALVDSLRDLATWWPEDERVVLVLHGAESLVEGDLPGWHTLTDILREASADLWRGGEPSDRVFETVALVDRHGVLTLPEDLA